MPKISPKRKSNEKWCCGCKKFCLKSSFSKHSNRKDGLNSWCKKCASKHETKYSFRRKQLYEKRISNVNYISWWEWKVKRNKLKVSAERLKEMYIKKPNCYYCKIKLGHRNIHIDHKIPRSKGGSDTIENLVISCPDCNRLKHQRTDKEFKDFLKLYLARFEMPTRANPKMGR